MSEQEFNIPIPGTDETIPVVAESLDKAIDEAANGMTNSQVHKLFGWKQASDRLVSYATERMRVNPQTARFYQDPPRVAAAAAEMAELQEKGVTDFVPVLQRYERDAMRQVESQEDVDSTMPTSWGKHRPSEWEEDPKTGRLSREMHAVGPQVQQRLASDATIQSLPVLDQLRHGHADNETGAGWEDDYITPEQTNIQEKLIMRTPRSVFSDEEKVERINRVRARPHKDRW